MSERVTVSGPTVRRPGPAKVLALFALGWLAFAPAAPVTAQETTTSTTTTTTSTTSTTTSTTSTSTTTSTTSPSTTSSTSSTSTTSTGPTTSTTAASSTTSTEAPTTITTDGDAPTTPGSGEERRRTPVGIRAPAGRQVLTTPGAPAARPAGEGLGRPPDLRQLVEDEPAEREPGATGAGGDDRAGTLVVGGFVVGPVVGLVLGLRDRAAMSAAAPPPPAGGAPHAR